MESKGGMIFLLLKSKFTFLFLYTRFISARGPCFNPHEAGTGYF